MPRWLAYDHSSEAALALRFDPAAVRRHAGDHDAILKSISAADEAAVAALLPASRGETLLITRRSLRTSSREPAPPRAYEATGFLGLHDEPIYDDEPAQPKTWWERFWD